MIPASRAKELTKLAEERRANERQAINRERLKREEEIKAKLLKEEVPLHVVGMTKTIEAAIDNGRTSAVYMISGWDDASVVHKIIADALETALRGEGYRASHRTIVSHGSIDNPPSTTTEIAVSW